MFLPLKDDTPLRFIRLQYVCFFLIALNVALYVLTGALAGEEALMATATGFGVVPTEILDLNRVPPAALNPVPEPATLLTYMFLHGGWMHLISNMAFLWVFGDNVEDAFGPVLFTLFYLLCGVAGAVFHVAMTPDSHFPLIGASGAVSGVLAAYLLLYPRARVWVLLFMRLPIRIPAYVALGAWAAFQVAAVAGFSLSEDAVAWWAHIGGFVVGLALALILSWFMAKKLAAR